MDDNLSRCACISVNISAQKLLLSYAEITFSVLRFPLFRLVWTAHKMDADAEKLCRKCHGCQVTGEPSKFEPYFWVAPLKERWKDCAINFLLLLPSGESLLVKVEYFGRFFEI